MSNQFDENAQNAHGRGAYKQDKKEPFLEQFKKYGTIVSAAKAVGISREVVYLWRREDHEFARSLDEINEEVTEKLEISAFQRAVEGIEKPIYYRGQRVGATREYSDALTMFLLKARNPQNYKDQCVHEEKEKLQKFSDETAQQLVSVLRRTIQDYCPGCKIHLGWSNKVSVALELESKRLKSQ